MPFPFRAANPLISSLQRALTSSLLLGMKWPLATAATAFHYVWPIDVDEEANLPPDRSLEGRFWDVVWMFHAAVKGTVPTRRVEPCNLLFGFYCIVADPSLWSNERIDATARGGPEGMRLMTQKGVSGHAMTVARDDVHVAGGRLDTVPLTRNDESAGDDRQLPESALSSKTF